LDGSIPPITIYSEGPLLRPFFMGGGDAPPAHNLTQLLKTGTRTSAESVTPITAICVM
jgi:hypothetical protein